MDPWLHLGTCFFAFDLLWNAGKDYRRDALVDRKHELKRLLSRVPASAPLRYADHVEAAGVALFERVCELDLEGGCSKEQARALCHGARSEHMVQDSQQGIFADGGTGGIIRT